MGNKLVNLTVSSFCKLLTICTKVLCIYLITCCHNLSLNKFFSCDKWSPVSSRSNFSCLKNYVCQIFTAFYVKNKIPVYVFEECQYIPQLSLYRISMVHAKFIRCFIDLILKYYLVSWIHSIVTFHCWQ